MNRNLQQELQDFLSKAGQTLGEEAVNEDLAPGDDRGQAVEEQPKREPRHFYEPEDPWAVD